MENHEESIRKIENRTRQLILLAVVVILYLTLSLLTTQLFSFISKSNSILPSEDAYMLSIFFSVLILFFCSHMIVQHRKIVTFSRKLINADETARNLDRDVMILSALLGVSSSINSQKRLSDILKIITREMLRCFDAHHTSIMLVERQKQILQTKTSIGNGAEFTKDAQIPIGEGIAGWVAKNGKPLLLNGEIDPTDFPGAKKKVRNITSAMCLPLKIGNKCIGVLNVNLIGSERTFSENDLKLTMVFANNAAVAIHNATLMEEKHQRIRFQTMLEQLHSPQVAKELVNRIEDWSQPNRMREKVEMTILFADIRGFSQMMSHVELEAIIEFLDEYYSSATRTVFRFKGSINKFIGDEVMAFFRAPIACENATEDAVRAALDIVTSFTSLKEKFSEISPCFSSLGIGIGINTGTVFVGNVGSKKRYDYTVIGNAVNVARRLCSYAAANEILAGTKTVEGLKGKHIIYHFIEKRSFKGIPYDIDIYRLLDDQVYRPWVNVRERSRTSREKGVEMKVI